jgi:hypothetical protein
MAKLKALTEPLHTSVDLAREEKRLISELNDGCDELEVSGHKAIEIHKHVLNTVRLQGNRLLRAKELVGHGGFVRWLNKNLLRYVPSKERPHDKKAGTWEPRISQRTAYNWMKAACWAEENLQVFANLRSVAQLYILAGIIPAPEQPEVQTEPAFSLAIALRYVKPISRLNRDAVLRLPPNEQQQIREALKPAYELFVTLDAGPSPVPA